MSEEYKSPLDMADDEIESLTRTLGGDVRDAADQEVPVSRLAGAAARLLAEKKALVASGKTRPVYRFAEGSEVVQKNWMGRGGWVVVRPCAERFENKTFLGILVGDVALSFSIHEAGEGEEEGTHVVELKHSRHNPLIYMPESGETVLGVGSWWGEIKGPEDLKRITDVDIDSVWYVRMLKELAYDL